MKNIRRIRAAQSQRLSRSVTDIGVPGMGGGPIPPANVTLPSFVGTPRDGTSATINVGVWSGTVTGFDLEVRSVEATPVVYFARGPIAHDTAINLNGAVGKTLEARVWAKNGAAETLAVSAPWGPVLAAGDEFIGAWAWGVSAFTPPSTPVQWTAIVATGGTIPTEARYPQTISGRSEQWGFGGSSVASAGNISSTGTGDTRQSGRMGANLSMSALHFRVGGLVPGAVYRIYGAAGRVNFAINTNIEVRDSVSGGTLLHSLAAASVGVNQTRDMAGNITSIAAWAAASDFGGSFVEITATATGEIYVGRLASVAPPQLNCFVITKKAA